MISEQEVRHQSYLHNLVSRLPLIGESPREVRSVIIEPTWFEHGNQHELCDLILLYRDFSASAIELKGSDNDNRRDKAIHQIFAGKTYIQEVLRYDFRYGLFVVYTSRGYNVEKLRI